MAAASAKIKLNKKETDRSALQLGEVVLDDLHKKTT